MKRTYFHAYGSLLLAVLIGAALGAAFGYLGQYTSDIGSLTSTLWPGALYGGALGLVVGAVSTSKDR